MRHSRNQPRLVVLGGSSVATPILLLAILQSVRARRIPAMQVRLWGRAHTRMQRIRDYVYSIATDADYVISRPAEISVHASMSEALDNADYILCQIRPGGMRGRAADERFAIDLGVPADEGIGPGGLSAFVRGKPAMEALLECCAQQAPNAVFLQMTGPLGLMTALARRYYPDSSYGICELPRTVSAKVMSAIAPQLEGGPFRHAVTGVNHCSWLHAFHDRFGADRTADFVEAIESAELLGVAPSTIRRYRALPLPYLRLILDAPAVLREQCSRAITRGEELEGWVSRLDAAFCAEGGVQVPVVRNLLAQRHIDWYEEGFIPVLEAFTGGGETELPLNLPSAGTMDGVPDEAVIETDSIVANGQARPLRPASSLPPLPDALTRQLIRYESLVLKLGRNPPDEALAEVLRCHPMMLGASAGSAA